MIKEVDSFDFLYNLDLDIKTVLFDIEETILKKNIYYVALSDIKFNRIFLSMCGDVRVSEVMYYGKNFKRHLTDARLPGIISRLKKDYRNVLALTTGYPSTLKQRRLNELQIPFDDIIYAYGQPKGPVLIDYIKQKDLMGNFIFIDNHLEKIENVERIFAEWSDTNFNNVFTLTSYLYKSSPTIMNVKTEKFIRYWTSVIDFVRKKRSTQYQGKRYKICANLVNDAKI